MESRSTNAAGAHLREGALWQAVLGEIELTVSGPSYSTWFKGTRLLHVADKELVVGVPNIFAKKQMEDRFNSLIREVLAKNGVDNAQITYKTYTPVAPQNKNHDDMILRSPTPAQPKSARGAATLAHGYRQGLNERYTFDNFIVGGANDLAYAACQAVANTPGEKYNPLFLYGGVGIGKTHLIQAVGNATLARNPNAKVVYVSIEQFVQEFLDAIRYKKNTDFTNYYRSADVLIVDDIQFIAGKEKTQDEFFHTFNALHQSNKQIIISSDRPPQEIPTLTDRLKSRFTMGMAVDMQTPDFETRCAIVQTKAGQHSVSLDPDVVDFLAKNISSNIRELEGALNQLLAFCDMRGVEPSLSVATSMISGLRSRPKHISVKQVVERTAKYFNLSSEELLGPKRDKEIVVPRQIAMYILRSDLHLSFPKIARELGRKDHTTAIHSVEKINKECEMNADLKATIEEIKEKIYA